MPDRPNVLYVAVDDLRPDLGCYGHPLVESPNIDDLAASGRRFENAYCQGPWCAPSRLSCLSGLYPQAIPDLKTPIHDMHPEIETLPQWFRNRGHTSVRVGKLYHQGVPFGMGTDGIDDPESWDDRVNPAGIDAVETFRGETDDDRIYRPDGSTWGYATDGLESEYTDSLIADETIERLEGFAESEESFFLAAGFYRPHTPRIAPQQYFDRYDLDDIESPREAMPDGYRDTIVDPVRRLTFERDGQDSLADATDETEEKQALRSYYASVSFLDRQVGRVLDALERTGLRDDTIVVFHADHGYGNGENYRYHKGTLYEHSLHVPLILDHPDLADRGASTDGLTELVDLYPTILDLCDEDAPDHCAGRPQTPVLEDPAVSVRTSALSQQRVHEQGVSIRTDRYRYTEWHTDEGVVAELYDHQTDPGEYRNLAESEDYSDVRSSLSTELESRHQDALFDPLE